MWAQVLFCKLCKEQRDLYRAYLNSQEVDAIFAGNRQALAGIDILRKICNHPDLLERTKWESSQEYGKPDKSGKLTVLMKVWVHPTASQSAPPPFPLSPPPPLLFCNPGPPLLPPSPTPSCPPRTPLQPPPPLPTSCPLVFCPDPLSSPPSTPPPAPPLATHQPYPRFSPLLFYCSSWKGEHDVSCGDDRHTKLL